MDNNILVLDKIKVLSLSIKRQMYLAIKRLFDMFVSLVGIIVLLPIMIIVKILYVATKDYNPIILKQERIGKNGTLFEMYKFRTMVPNSEKILKKMLKNKKIREEYMINHKLENDPRITKIGRVLRKASLDELPQMINVFKGNMSLIGNRPYLPREKEDMGTYYNEIVKTKPGLTGLWQVRGRNNLTFEERLKIESEYSKKYSLRLDAHIFVKTFAVILHMNGAK